MLGLYHALGAKVKPFEDVDKNLGNCFFEWLRVELEDLPIVVEGLMVYSTLVMHKGTINALVHEGWHHFDRFGSANFDTSHDVYNVEDMSVRRPDGMLFKCMWGAHGLSVVRDRVDREME